MADHFLSDAERQAAEDFFQQGMWTFPLDDRDALGKLQDLLHQSGCAYLDQNVDRDAFFNQTQAYVDPSALNPFRLHLIRRLNQEQAEVRRLLYRMAASAVHTLVGNELAMQRSFSLSVQLPQDDSSLLPLHSDVWSGNSPYEVVFWLPLTRVNDTRSMYVLPKPASEKVLANYADYAHLDAEQFFQAVKDDAVWIDLEPGHGLIFWHGLIHGNRINREAQTRWTMNTRFKSLLSPYGAKELGESFLPIITRPATRLGYTYKAPGTKP